MNIRLMPINDDNRDAVLSLSVREDQPFVAPNDVSLRQADEANAEQPGVARPFAIYADEKLVGFCMFAFDPEEEDEDDRYWLWRFMIDKNEQDKGYGQAALREIIQYFRDNGADRLFLSTEPENERGLHIYHKAGFRETGIIEDDEAVMMRMLKGPNRMVKNFYGVDVDQAMRIRGKRGYGVSIAVQDGDGDFLTYCSGSGRYGEDYPVNPDMLFQAGSVSKPMFALTLLRYVDKGKIDLDADISGVVPEFVKKGPVTFAALLSHTAGYNVHGFPGYPANHEPLSLEDVLDGKGNTPRLRRIRPYGKQHMYSGGGITLAQKEDPAHGYHYYPEHAAAGLWTTPTELVKIGIALSRSYRRGGFLKKKMARRMMTPIMDDYGLCLNVWESEARKDSVAGHGGENWGFLTSWVFSRKKDICVAVMYNNVTEAADKAMDDIACEIYRNAKD